MTPAERAGNDHAARDRKVLIVITDGNDNASTASLDQIRQAAEQREILIYAVGLANEGSRTKIARHELDQLAERTGGFAYYPASIDAVGAAALEIAQKIRNQYTLAYAPVNQALDGSYRAIRVEVSGAERFSVRTRAGYRASKP